MNKVKALKMIFRFNFGFGIGILLWTAIFKISYNLFGIFLRIVLFAIYVGIYLIFWKIRAKKSVPFCNNCDLGRYPFCKENYIYIKKAIEELEAKNLTEITFYKMLTSLEIQIREDRGQDLVKIIKF
ncbi:MAG: hypothetical protein ACTSRK_01885 [Promethearchaeota archaeon]